MDESIGIKSSAVRKLRDQGICEDWTLFLHFLKCFPIEKPVASMHIPSSSVMMRKIMVSIVAHARTFNSPSP